MAVISVKNISKCYKRTILESGLKNSVKSFFFRKYEKVKALDSINIDIEKGERVALIGGNGAGKSTLIKMLVGIIQPTSGSIEVAGFKPSIHNNRFKKNYAVVLGKKNQLWWDIPAIETFLLLKEMYGIEEKEYQKTLDELVDVLNVREILNRPVRNLSLGERMKCELIAALLHKPSIVIMDEPSIGLDFNSQKSLRKFIKSYCSENNVNLIMTSHYLPDIEELCDRVIILKKGKVDYDGSLKELLHEINKFVHLSLSFDKDISSEDLKGLGQVTDRERDKVTITVEKSRVNEVFSRLSASYNILDSKMEPMNTIDLLAKMYTSEDEGLVERVF